MTTPVDLQQLAVNRGETARPLVRKRVWLTRWGLPALIVAGFIAVTAWSARDHLLPARPVSVIPVILTRAEVQSAGTPLFQAAGWVEPRPMPVVASALAEGVVEKLLVIEGQEVAAGEPLAQLFDTDARLALREAQATTQLREAELALAKATVKAAETNVDQPVQLEAAFAESEAALARLRTEIMNLPFAIRAAEARLTFARQDLDAKRSLSDAIAARALQKAQSEFDAATAALQELKQREPNLQAELQASQRKCDALRRRYELKTDEMRQLEEAQASMAAAYARLSQAELAVETARLRLERMTIRSPIQGRVLALYAQPGRRLMGLNAGSERDASVAVSLYDPKQLQVRADVRLEDVSQVQLGQSVKITTAALSEPLHGKVLAVTSLADIQKNTLQVKIAIEDPPQVIKPDMLVQVVFQAPTLPQSDSAGDDPLRLLVPREVVETTAEGTTIWVADLAAGVARQKPVQLGKAATAQLVEVAQGLSPLDKLIVAGRDGLQDGVRIRVTGEDTTLGTTGLLGQPGDGSRSRADKKIHTR